MTTCTAERKLAYWIVKNAKGEYWSNCSVWVSQRYLADCYPIKQVVTITGARSVPVYLTVIRRPAALKQHDFGWALRMVRRGKKVKRGNIPNAYVFDNEVALAIASTQQNVLARDWVRA